MITPTFAAEPDGYVILTPISVGKIPDGVFLNLDTNRAYIPNTGSNTVSVIDTTTNTVIDTIKVGVDPEGMVINPDTNRAYVANTGSNNVSVIDTTTNTVIDTIRVGIFPDTVEVNPDTNRVYVTNEDSGTVSVIDTTTNTVIDTIAVGGCTIDSSVDRTTNLLYVAGCRNNIASVIDTTINTVIDTIKVGKIPWSIEVNSDTNRVYVVNKGSGTVSVIDTTTHTVIDTIEVGVRPFGIAVNPDTNRAYVPNTGSNTVSVIDTTTNTVIDTIEVGVAPKDIALNPLTNRIYVANSGSNNVSIIDLNIGAQSKPVPESETLELESKTKVPEWIKNNAGWWADGAIGDSDFASGLEYLIKEKIILVSEQTISNFEDYYVVLHLNLGKIIIEFFPDEAPNHVEKFFELTQSGFYDGTLFHRVIPGFMIQGGDPNTKTEDKSIWGTGSPGYTINEEFNSINHNRGIVSMARSADPNSAGSQFFIVHQDSRFLDGQYTVFGKIVTQESFDTLDKIASTPVGDKDIPKDPSETLINKTEIISKSETQESTINQEIPDWVKNNAKWWADGLISEDEFLNGVKYMIENGIIRV